MEANLQLAVQEAQRQLAEIERQADSLLTTLSSTAVEQSAKSTPHSIVTDAWNALKGYEAAVSRLKPVLDSVAAQRQQDFSKSNGGGTLPVPSAVLDALWKKANPDNRAFIQSKIVTKQSKALPDQPATTLDALMATFHQNFNEKIIIEISEKHKRVLIITLQGLFTAHILLEPLESVNKSIVLDALPIDIDIKPTGLSLSAEGGGAAKAPPPPHFIQQLKSAAFIAMLEMKSKNKLNNSVAWLEMVVLWLTLCAARIKGSRTHPRLKLDLSTGTYVPVFPKFSELVWKEAWEQAIQDF